MIYFTLITMIGGPSHWTGQVVMETNIDYFQKI